MDRGSAKIVLEKLKLFQGEESETEYHTPPMEKDKASDKVRTRSRKAEAGNREKRGRETNREYEEDGSDMDQLSIGSQSKKAKNINSEKTEKEEIKWEISLDKFDGKNKEMAIVMKEIEELGTKVGDAIKKTKKNLINADGDAARITNNIAENNMAILLVTIQKAAWLIEYRKLATYAKKTIDEYKIRDMGTQSSPTLEGQRNETKTRETERFRARKNEEIRKNKTKKRIESESEREEPDSKETTRNRTSEWIEANNKKRDREARKKYEEGIEKERRERARLEKMVKTKKAEAIIIKKTETKTYAEMLKNIRQEMGNNLTGIQTIRKTRGGDVLLELEKDADTTKTREKVNKVLGSVTEIKTKTPNNLYEIKGVDPSLEDDEIINELARELDWNKDTIKIKSKKENYYGNNNIIIEIPDNEAKNIEIEKTVKIGYTKCTIRRVANIVRCYKCHDFGHISYNCKKIKDGIELCRRCGFTGHSIRECKNKNRCILCIREGVHESNVGHVAGAISCPQYKKYIGSTKGRQFNGR